MKNVYIFSFLFLFFLGIGCKSNDQKVDLIEKLCLSESEKIAGMSQGLIEYCACAAPKILAHSKDIEETPKYKAILKLCAEESLN